MFPCAIRVLIFAMAVGWGFGSYAGAFRNKGGRSLGALAFTAPATARADAAAAAAATTTSTSSTAGGGGVRRRRHPHQPPHHQLLFLSRSQPQQQQSNRRSFGSRSSSVVVRAASDSDPQILCTTAFDDGQRPFAITTPIYYVNDKPHIGHAYTSTGTV
jgi:hypothetical protein